IPQALAGPLGVLLPLAELAVAIALIPVSTVWYGANGAAALLLLFIAGIVVNMAPGRAPDCPCFGQLHSEPVGWSTLVRNALLVVVAGLLIVPGPAYLGLSMFAWLGDLTTAQRAAFFGGVIGLLLLGGEAFMLSLLLGQIGRVLLRLDSMEARLEGGA